MKRKTIIKKMCLSAMFIAIAYIVTAFIGIPFYTGGGYLNFGDAIIILSSIILGPWYGAVIGIVSASLADLTVSAAMFIPFTIVAKGLEAIICYFLYKWFPKYIKWLGLFIGALFMVATYMVAYYVYYDLYALINTCFDLIQAAASVAIGYGLIVIYNKLWPYKI